MSRLFTTVAIGMVAIAATQAFDSDAFGQSTMSKRQRIALAVSCMKKRMSVDKSISYNEAARICKGQINDQENKLASVAVAASDFPTRP